MDRSRHRFGGTARVVAAAALAVSCAAACTGPDKPRPEPTGATAVPATPSRPQVLTIVDVTGDLQLTQPILDDFQKQHPEVVSRIVTGTAAEAALVPRIKAEEGAGRLDVDAVFTGTDGLAAGIAEHLWLPLPAARLPDPAAVYTPASARMQQLAQDQAVVVAESASGPLIEYDPARVPDPPTTADELLAWARANPGRFEYAVPRNSAPGRSLLTGLPYILGDSDPADPAAGWPKTWAYLAELAQYQPAFPSGTAQTMRDLANGTATSSPPPPAGT